MAKITRIKASDPGKSKDEEPVKEAKTVKVSAKAKNSTKVEKTTKAKKPAKTTKTIEKTEKETKKPFILIRPLVYFGRYLRDSWAEIRQVRWPSRKTTWKLFLAILVYTLIFVVVIMLLDALFSWLFNTVIS